MSVPRLAPVQEISYTDNKSYIKGYTFGEIFEMYFSEYKPVPILDFPDLDTPADEIHYMIRCDRTEEVFRTVGIPKEGNVLLYHHNEFMAFPSTQTDIEALTNWLEGGLPFSYCPCYEESRKAKNGKKKKGKKRRKRRTWRRTVCTSCTCGYSCCIDCAEEAEFDCPKCGKSLIVGD